MFDDLFTLKTPEPGDYLQGEVLFCGNCRTPRQKTINLCGDETKVTVLCKCREEENERGVAEREAQEHKVRVDARRVNALPDKGMRNWTFENDDKTNSKLSYAMQKYCDNFSKFKEDGKGLMLYGGLGTGKSFFAACIVNRLVEQYKAKFITTSFLATLKFDSREDFIKEVERADIVVLDDIGAERGTEYMQELIFSIIDVRTRNGLPLIVTTNLAPDQINKSNDFTTQRIFDRIIGSCHPIACVGKSRRRQNAGRELAKVSEILGL